MHKTSRRISENFFSIYNRWARSLLYIYIIKIYYSFNNFNPQNLSNSSLKKIYISVIQRYFSNRNGIRSASKANKRCMRAKLGNNRADTEASVRNRRRLEGWWILARCVCACLIVHGCLRSDVYQRNELSNAWVLACTRYRNVRFSRGNVVPFQKKRLCLACRRVRGMRIDDKLVFRDRKWPGRTVKADRRESIFQIFESRIAIDPLLFHIRMELSWERIGGKKGDFSGIFFN